MGKANKYLLIQALLLRALPKQADYTPCVTDKQSLLVRECNNRLRRIMKNSDRP
jgi:hypothetical protein